MCASFTPKLQISTSSSARSRRLREGGIPNAELIAILIANYLALFISCWLPSLFAVAAVRAAAVAARTLHTLAAATAAACIGCNGRARLHKEGGYVVACSCFRGCAISLQRSWTTVNNFWCIIIIIIVKKVQLVLPKLQVWDQSKIFNGKLQMYFCNAAAAAAAVHKCRSSSQ